MMAAVRKLPVKSTAPDRAPAPPTHYPLVLKPIPWGTPDRALGLALCQHIVEATAPTLIPFNPRTHRRLKSDLSRYTHY